jgi:hypothetical protein
MLFSSYLNTKLITQKNIKMKKELEKFIKEKISKREKNIEFYQQEIEKLYEEIDLLKLNLSLLKKS